MPSLVRNSLRGLLLVGLLVSTSLAHSADTITANLSQGLLIHFPFDRNILSKGSLSLVAQHLPPVPHFVGGPVGYAYQFTISKDPLQSTGSHFIWNAPMGLAGDKISISVWLKTSGSTDSNLDFFGVETPHLNSSTTPVYSLGYDTVFKSGALIAPRIYFKEFVQYPVGSCCSGQRTFPSAGPDIANDKWVHIVYTRDKTTDQVRVWYDGVEGAGSQETVSLYQALESGSLLFLGRPSSQSQSFFGNLAIDDLRVYDRLISSQEVTALFQMGIFPVTVKLPDLTPILMLLLD